MMTFVDLTFLPEDKVSFPGPGIYAIVEPTTVDPNLSELEKSELWEPWVKLPSRWKNAPPGWSKQELQW